MSRQPKTDSWRRVGWFALHLALAAAGGGITPLHAATDADAVKGDEAAVAAVAEPEATQAAQGRARHRQSGSPLDRRVSLLAKELGLDAAQQAQVKKVLESQREQVARLWNDTSMPAARRVSATQAIGDQTADQIRALLNDEQRKKYIQPHKRDAAVGAAGSDVESWTKSGGRK